MKERAARFYENMKRRRTVRHFSDRQVPREIIEDCLRVAGSAPSGANMTRYGYLPELIKHGETGFLVDSVEEAAEAVQRLAQIAPRACRVNVETRFSALVMAAGYERVYRKLVGQEE